MLRKQTTIRKQVNITPDEPQQRKKLPPTVNITLTKGEEVMFRVDIRKHFFTEKVVKHWNKLLREVVNAPRLSVFKRQLGNALNNML